MYTVLFLIVWNGAILWQDSGTYQDCRKWQVNKTIANERLLLAGVTHEYYFKRDFKVPLAELEFKCEIVR